MWIIAHFAHSGVPVDGLSPTVLIRDIDNDSVVVSGGLMTEKGDGFYGYYFDAYNPERDYTVVCDSVTLSGTERYTYASSGEYATTLENIESTIGAVDVRTSLLRKIQTNRLELFDGDSDNWVLYDDDGVTPLLTFDVSDKNGDLIVQHPNSPSRRSHAVGSISGSVTPDVYMLKSVYDPNGDGFVSNAANVSDGVYTSTALDVRTAVDNTHSPTWDASPDTGWSGDITEGMYIDSNDTGVGCPLYMKTNGHWSQCAASSGTMPCLAMSVESGTGLKTVLWQGVVKKSGWVWNTGDVIYVSTTTGELTQTPPTDPGSWTQPVGVAIGNDTTTDTIRFIPGFNPGILN